MKNTFKRTLALALAIVMLLSVSVIGVSAEETEVALNGGVMTDTVAIYEFWQEKYASDSNFLVNFGATDMTNTLKDHYDNGELNWRIAWNTVATDSCTGKSLFSAGRPYHYVQIGKSTGNSFYGLYLKNPGAGTYDVTLNYSVTNDIQAASEMKAYLFPATFVENSVAGGAQWKYVISGNDDNAENGTDTNGIIYLGSYSCYDANVSQYEERSLVKNGVELSSEQEYILVLAAVSTNGTASTLKHYTNKLALEKTSANVAAETKSYGFYLSDYAGATLAAQAATIKSRYESTGSDHLSWRYETATNEYQMNRNNKFNNNLKKPYETLRLSHYAPSSTVPYSYVALRIESPGTGEYQVALTHGQQTDGGQGEVYLLPASEVEALVEADGTYDYDTLATEIAAGLAENRATTAAPNGPVRAAIESLLPNTAPVIDNVNYYNTADTAKVVTNGTKYTFNANEEYIVIFTVKAVSYMYLNSLDLTPVAPAVAVIESPESAEINFTGYANGSTLYSNKAAMDAAYAAGAAWNFEMCENPTYYFEGGRSYFKDAVAGIEQWMGTAGFLAVRIKSPVSGEYDVTLSHGTSTRGATGGEFYLVPAPNAAYTDTEVKDLMANSTAVASTNFTGGTVTNNNLVYGDVKTLDSFRYTFTAGQEYLLIAKVTEGTTLSTAAGGTANYGYLYMSGIELTPTVSYKSAGEYDTLRAAIKAAEEANEGATVTMLADAELVNLGVTCNIDLNGNDLTVYGDMTSVATVSDSKDGEGVLTVTGEMILAGTQAQLPLYDAAVNGCRLYSVTWGDNNQSEAAVNNAKKYWFQLYFDNTAAYDLIATGTSGLSIGVVLDWDTDSKAFDFVDKTEHTAAAFAAGWGEFMKTAKTPWIWVNVLNVVEGVTVTPVIEANGAQIACAPIA